MRDLLPTVLRKRGGLGEKEEGLAIQEAVIKANRTNSGRAEPSRAERRFSAALKEFQPWQERCMEKERVGEQEKKVTCSGKKTSHHKWGDFQSWVMLVRKCSFYDSKEPRKTVILQPPHLDLPTVLFLFVFLHCFTNAHFFLFNCLTFIFFRDINAIRALLVWLEPEGEHIFQPQYADVKHTRLTDIFPSLSFFPGL